MSTKVIIVGNQTVKVKEPKPIVFRTLLNYNKNLSAQSFGELEPNDGSLIPSHYKFIELISKGYFLEVDLMFAYDDPNLRNEGVLVLGQFNDGVVETF